MTMKSRISINIKLINIKGNNLKSHKLQEGEAYTPDNSFMRSRKIPQLIQIPSAYLQNHQEWITKGKKLDFMD